MHRTRVMLKLQPGSMRYYSSATYLRLWRNKRAIVIRSTGINSSLRDPLFLFHLFRIFYLLLRHTYTREDDWTNPFSKIEIIYLEI